MVNDLGLAMPLCVQGNNTATGRRMQDQIDWYELSIDEIDPGLPNRTRRARSCASGSLRVLNGGDHPVGVHGWVCAVSESGSG